MTNRWYKSTSGLAIEVLREDEHGSETLRRVPNSDSSTVANRLSDFSLPNELDLGHYIDNQRLA
jgi:hypothetical protein